jgi:mannose-6-phosphate isomerase-like protein (cupin superfamily)
VTGIVGLRIRIGFSRRDRRRARNPSGGLLGPKDPRVEKAHFRPAPALLLRNGSDGLHVFVKRGDGAGRGGWVRLSSRHVREPPRRPAGGQGHRSLGADLVLTEVIDPGGGTDPPTFIAPLHIHDRDDEAWYVLEGALAFRVDASELEVPAGGGIVVPRGAAHTFWNPSPRPTRYLIVMTATIHRLVEALHDPQGHADMSALFREHDSTLIGWP